MLIGSLAPLALLPLATWLAADVEVGPGPAPAYDREVQPLLARYCYDCHGQGSARGEVALDGHASAKARRADGALWTRVWENVRNGTMPPRGKPRPSAAEQELLGRWVQQDVQGVDCRAPDPGRVTLRRLNRDEYNHTIADLFGIDFRPADDFPPDDSGYGFDNIGSVLAVSPVLADKYFSAAEQIVAKVVAARPEIPRRVLQRDDLRLVEEPAPRVTVSEGRFTINHRGPHAVALRVSVNSFRPFFGKARMLVQLDGRPLLRATYLPGNRVYRRAHRLLLEPGEHVVRVQLDLSSAQANAGRTVNIGLDELVVTGPLGGHIKEYPPAHQRLFFRGPPPPQPEERQQYAREILSAVAGKALRRPVEPETVDRLLALAGAAERQSGRFESGIAQALQAILISPRFLFRPEGGQGTAGVAGQLLDEHALATRLSYLFQASAPDDQLRALATAGRLRAELPAQVRRLLQDPRSDRFVARFVGQWLQTRDVETVALANDLGRLMTTSLRRQVRAETEMMFAHVMRQDRDLMELVTADYSFLNATLARHYGIAGVEGPALRLVKLPPDQDRGGILGHASVLMVTSNPNRTSPVKRGVFVLDNLLGAPPAPPPPNVPSLDGGKDEGQMAPRTMRQQLALHREKAACAGCHARMDPLGLALESFDPLGRIRREADGQPVDSSATLAGGEPVQGVAGVRALLLARRPQVYRAVTRKLMIFALGRGLEPADECTVDALVGRLMAQGGKLSSLLEGIVTSVPFQQQRGSRS